MDQTTTTFHALQIAKRMQALDMDIDTELCSCGLGGTFKGEAEVPNGGKIEISVTFHPHELEEEGSAQLEKILGVKFSRSTEQMIGALTLSSMRLQQEVLTALSEMMDEDDDGPFGNMPYDDGPFVSSPYQRQPGFVSRLFGNGN